MKKCCYILKFFFGKKAKKNNRLKHHVEHEGIRYFSMPSRGWRKQRKNAALRQEKRTS
jgi:hypothetical protein